ncbi:MAG: hypothetical protein ACLU6E_01995 [Dysosmobacter welbionis]|uniref:hypothetical protein n=1 Tax=Dysosmobacter welbionis TaxID=2093857 RepID=UPI00399B1BE7
MNKSNEIIQITSSVLERYRSSIPRKAFAEAMERVIESVLGPGECPAKSDCPGLVMLRAPNMDAEHMAQLICGACPPFPLELGGFSCCEQDCQSCWKAWLETGRPPQVEAMVSE